MKITLNDVQVNFKKKINLIKLIKMHNNNNKGIAISVNSKIITKHEWKNYFIQNEDNIVIFQAIAGG